MSGVLTPPAPTPGAPWPDLTVEEPADHRVVAATVVVAAAADVAVRSGPAGVAGGLVVAVVAGSLLASRRLVNRHAQAAALAAPLFGVWLATRTSPWLLPLDVLAAASLLVMAASLARDGSLLHVTLPDLFWRALHAVPHGAAGPLFVAGALRTPAAGRAGSGAGPVRTGLPVVRGLALAAPVVLVLGLLLSSADAVFASFFRLEIDPLSLVGHAVVMAGAGWAMAGLLRLASATPMVAVRIRAPRLGRVESITVLACLDGLYTAFAVAQLVALSSGGRRVIETAGLTYATYARSGFFQLLAVATLTLAVLLALRAVTELDGPARRSFLVLGEIAVALTLVIVLVAVRRLRLYDQAFGLTMLRLYSMLFAAWVAAVFVLLGCALAGLGQRCSWLVPGAAAVGLAGLLAVNAANPEAMVVRHNVAHAERTGRFDAGYAVGLSADAVPALVEALPRLDDATRDQLLAGLCGRYPRPRSWLSFNASTDRARDALHPVCPGRDAARPGS